MEIKIGIRNAARELVLDSTETAEEIERQVAEAVSSPEAVLNLTDDKGRKIIVPAQALAYVELGPEHSRPVGFGTL